MNPGSRKNRASRKNRSTGLIFKVGVACLIAVAQPVFADPLSQNFDSWAVQTNWANSTNSDGWIISYGEVRGGASGGIGWKTHSPQNAGWLCDYDVSTNSWVKSPLLQYGVADVSYWYKAYVYSTGTNFFDIQYSSNGTSWVSGASVATTNTAIWMNRQDSLNVLDPVYVRFYKTGEVGTADQYQGLDDIVMTEPPGVLLSNLQHLPESPSTDESVDISANVAIRQGMSNVQLSAMYRGDPEAAFQALPMAFLTGSVYKTTTPIPAGVGVGGSVQYYVQATCSGHGPSVIYLPEEGSNAPASYEPESAYALAIANPVSRAVYQRDALNYGTVPIAGTFSGTVDSVEARAVAMDGFSGTAVDWTAIGSGAGQFSGSLRIKGGWYRIEVRAIKGGQVVDIASVERVGVGEVFVAIGESNAANFGDPPMSPLDDRVSAYDPSVGWRHADDPQPGAAGAGGSPWPAMGDRLVAEYDVPVAILSRGVGSTTVSQWLPGSSLYPTITNALAMTGSNGVRAVLWHQGESDSVIGTPSAGYKSSLGTIIEQSRIDAGYAVPWGVALASYDQGATTQNQAQVIAGQLAVITDFPLVFLGAQTDNFHALGYTATGGTNFNAAGLAEHGRQWAECVRSNSFLKPTGSVVITNMSIDVSGRLSVGWSADSNVTYQVQSKTNLLQGSWTNAGEWVIGPGGHSFTNQPDKVRFYRIVAPFTHP